MRLYYFTCRDNLRDKSLHHRHHIGNSSSHDRNVTVRELESIRVSDFGCIRHVDRHLSCTTVHYERIRALGARSRDLITIKLEPNTVVPVGEIHVDANNTRGFELFADLTLHTCTPHYIYHTSFPVLLVISAWWWHVSREV